MKWSILKVYDIRSFQKAEGVEMKNSNNELPMGHIEGVAETWHLLDKSSLKSIGWKQSWRINCRCIQIILRIKPKRQESGGDKDMLDYWTIAC